MKVVILAGGLGTRLAEETETRPKPMVEIGGYPVLWHIMKHYSAYGFKEFVVALGYKGEMIKRYFVDYITLSGDLTVSLGHGHVKRHGSPQDEWTVQLIDTGKDTQTGGRIARLAPILGDEPFMLTYGDGVSNIDLNELLAFHQGHGKTATISAVRPPSRFGGLEFAPGGSVRFNEKPQMGEGWINGGFMVMEPRVLGLIDGDMTNFEADVLERLGLEGDLMGFPHTDFWQCMDTLRELRFLRALWDEGRAPWVTWQ
ncbi:MAG TPA: glucose-1-phosphate cytidylyltransferase [Actinomycetota bacterium]|nr:glucose-1-phosphate cytidylyltransferase [Actinomycetota bacterium]